MAEQLDLLERSEIAPDGTATALLLPDDLPALREWIEEDLARCGASASARRYPGSDPASEGRAFLISPHAWVLRDLVAALPDRIAATHRHLLTTRERGNPVDAREVRTLIAAVEAGDRG